MEHNEFVVELKDGSRDWIDPVKDIWEDETTIYIENGYAQYEFLKADIDKWIVRPYDPETTYDWI